MKDMQEIKSTIINTVRLIAVFGTLDMLQMLLTPESNKKSDLK